MRNKDNLNQRVIRPVHRAANALRLERGQPSLPADLSAHAFRRTYPTLMIEAGASPRYVQRQLGHGSATLTLAVYTRVSESRDRARLGQAFDELVAGAIAGGGTPPADVEERAEVEGLVAPARPAGAPCTGQTATSNLRVAFGVQSSTNRQLRGFLRQTR